MSDPYSSIAVVAAAPSAYDSISAPVNDNAPKAPADARAPNTYADVVKSAVTGLAKAATGVIGLPGDLRSLLDTGANKVRQYFDPSAQPISTANTPLAAPTSAQVDNAVQSVMGAYHQPKTMAGKYAEIIASFLPAAIAPGGAAVRRIARVVVPGAASEGAGELAQKYAPSLEPYARVVGALAGGAATGIGEGMMNESERAATVPTTAALKKADDAAYAAVRNQPVQITPETASALSDRFGQDAISGALDDAELNRDASAAAELKALKAGVNPGQTVSAGTMDLIRQRLNAAGGDAATNYGAKGYYGRESDVDTTIQQAPSINDARATHAAFKKSQLVDEALQNAENVKNTPAGYGAYDQALRREFGKIVRSDDFASFTPAEQAAIKNVANGTFTANALQQIGKLSPVRSNLSRWGELLAGASGMSSAGPAGAVPALAVAAGGEAARQGAVALTSRAARIASETVRSGGKELPDLLSQSVARGTATSAVLGRPQADNTYVDQVRRSLNVAR